MVLLRQLPALLSLLVLAAHFLRAGRPVLVLASLTLAGLVFVRRPWAARAVQVALVLAAAEWIRTLVEIAGRRMEQHEPVTRMAIILGAVALVSVLSAVLLSTRALRRWYGFPP